MAEVATLGYPPKAAFSSLCVCAHRSRNYLLFACHGTNAAAQLIQSARFVNYWYMGGKDKKVATQPIAAKAAEAVDTAKAAASK